MRGVGWYAGCHFADNKTEYLVKEDNSAGDGFLAQRQLQNVSYPHSRKRALHFCRRQKLHIAQQCFMTDVIRRFTLVCGTQINSHLLCVRLRRTTNHLRSKIVRSTRRDDRGMMAPGCAGRGELMFPSFPAHHKPAPASARRPQSK